LRWPDGFSFDGNGYLYITASALQYKFSREDMGSHKPFHILRVKLDKEGIAGQ